MHTYEQSTGKFEEMVKYYKTLVKSALGSTACERERDQYRHALWGAALVLGLTQIEVDEVAKAVGLDPQHVQYIVPPS